MTPLGTLARAPFETSWRMFRSISTITTSGQTGGGSSSSQTVVDFFALGYATGQSPNTTAYNTLNVRGLPGGSGYTDPTSGLTIWKITSASTPQSNTVAFHNYSEGQIPTAHSWGTGLDYTSLFFTAGAQWLCDLQRGVGPSNYRQFPTGCVPAAEDSFTFASNKSTPQIGYLYTGTQLRRFNTSTNTHNESGTNFPKTIACGGWLQSDKSDRTFVMLGTGTNQVLAWDSTTNSVLTLTSPGLDEPYLDTEGRYVFINSANSSNKRQYYWDLQSNTTSVYTMPGNTEVGHMPTLRNRFWQIDVNTGAGHMPTWRFTPPDDANDAQVYDFGGYWADGHSSGCPIQPDSEISSDLNRQWWMRNTMDAGGVISGSFPLKNALGVIMSSATSPRFLCHHYSVVNGGGPTAYWSQPRANLGADGRWPVFTSSNSSQGRTDVYVLENLFRVI